MLTRLIYVLAAVLTIAAVSPPRPPAPGDTLPPLHVGSAELTCPIGGQRFSAVTTNMWSITGRRPDEKPYSEVPFPRPLPECPGNGLVLFSSFTPTEVAELERWIATTTYQSMRKTESPFYRAYWLSMKIRRPEADSIEQLLPAIWEAKEQDGKDPRRIRTTRYQRALVGAVGRISSNVSLDDRIWLRSQAANALREMGKFDAAERMRQTAEADLPHTTRPALSDYLQKLKAVIARHDRSDEPLDMIPDVQAALLCRNSRDRNAFDRAYCSRPTIVSIFGPVDLTSPSAIARRDDMWRKIMSDARACNVRVGHRKVTTEDATSLGMTYKMEPNTPNAQLCMWKQSQNNGEPRP